MAARTQALLLILCLAFVRTARADDHQPAATPYRPSVSAPAAMSEPTKLAFNPDWGLVLGSELGVRRADFSGNTFNSAGDVTALVKHRFATASEDSAWGVMAGAKLPTANGDIGSGKTDLILTGIFSKDFAGSNHLDLNLGATRPGAYGAGEGRMQYGWAAAWSHGLNDQWSVFAEPSGTYHRAAPSTAQLMLGASYAMRRRTVFDVALARGLTSLVAGSYIDRFQKTGERWKFSERRITADIRSTLDSD